MKNLTFVFILIISFSLNSCIGQNSSYREIGGFDISSDDSFMVFSLKEKNKSSLYKFSFETGIKTLLASVEGDYVYANPRISNDMKKVVFVNFKKGYEPEDVICIIDIETKKILTIEETKGVLMEAIFSKYNHEILFIKFNEVSANSPLVSARPKGADVFSYDLVNKEVQKVTNINAYGMYHLSELNEGVLVFYLSGMEAGMNKFYRTKNEKELIVPKNDPIGGAEYYYFPTFSEVYKTMVFTAPFKLFVMNVNSEQANLIFSNVGNSDINGVSIFNNTPKVLFSQDEDINFYTLNLDGTGLKQLKIFEDVLPHPHD